MRRALPLAFLLLAAVPACNRPTEENCRKAIQNIDKVTGRTPEPVDVAAAVRTCRAEASEEAVACWIAAKSPADVEACEKKK